MRHTANSQLSARPAVVRRQPNEEEVPASNWSRLQQRTGASGHAVVNEWRPDDSSAGVEDWRKFEALLRPQPERNIRRPAGSRPGVLIEGLFLWLKHICTKLNQQRWVAADRLPSKRQVASIAASENIW